MKVSSLRQIQARETVLRFRAWLKQERSQQALKTLFLILLGFLGGRISAPGYKEEERAPERLPAMARDGASVDFPVGSRALQLIKVTAVNKGAASMSAIAPGRVVLTSIFVGKGKDPIILFESPDMTTLYSQYKQAKSNVNRTKRNFDRTKDMYENQAATGKELNDSENEFVTSRVSLTEFEVKLRTAGFSPDDLDKMGANTAWIISDVPETEIQEVDPGEEVKIVFSSFPNETVLGRADAKGDAVDPATRTIKVRVSLPNPNRKFMPGMFTKVDFGVLPDGAVVVPSSALVTVEDKDYVFIATTLGRFEKRQVFAHSAGADMAVVAKGLNPGEQVVSGGTMLLKGLFFTQ